MEVIPHQEAQQRRRVGLSGRRDSADDLTKFYSKKQREKIGEILDSENPGHYERLFAVGRLKSVGYSGAQVEQILKERTTWAHNDRVTHSQVRSVTPRSMSLKGQKRAPAKTKGLLDFF